MLSRLYFSAFSKYFIQLIDSEHTRDYTRLLPVCEAEILRVTVKRIEVFSSFYPPTKSEGYSFGVVHPSVHSVRPSFCPSIHTFCLFGTISQYLLVRFNSLLVQIISTMNSRYPISLVKIDPLTLVLLPLF